MLLLIFPGEIIDTRLFPEMGFVMYSGKKITTLLLLKLVLLFF